MWFYMKYKCTKNVNSKKSKVTNTYVYVLYMSLAQSKNKHRLKIIGIFMFIMKKIICIIC